MAMFRDFHTGDLPLFSLNFGIITLLPKEKEVKKIQQYQPICEDLCGLRTSGWSLPSVMSD
jgi:hypothetical protein